MDYDVLSILAGVIGLAIGYRLAVVPLHLLPKLGVRLTWNGILVAAIICAGGVALSIHSTFAWIDVGRLDAVPVGAFLCALFAGAVLCLGHLMYRVVRKRG